MQFHSIGTVKQTEEQTLYEPLYTGMKIDYED